MHNGYFYPQDIKVSVVDGIRVAVVDFTLPTKWTEAALNVFKICKLSGWELARRAYEDEQSDIWLKATYPEYHEEKLAAKEAHQKGMSVTEFRRHCEANKRKSK